MPDHHVRPCVGGELRVHDPRARLVAERRAGVRDPPRDVVSRLVHDLAGVEVDLQDTDEVERDLADDGQDHAVLRDLDVVRTHIAEAICVAVGRRSQADVQRVDGNRPLCPIELPADDVATRMRGDGESALVAQELIVERVVDVFARHHRLTSSGARDGDDSEPDHDENQQLPHVYLPSLPQASDSPRTGWTIPLRDGKCKIATPSHGHGELVYESRHVQADSSAPP